MARGIYRHPPQPLQLPLHAPIQPTGIYPPLVGPNRLIKSPTVQLKNLVPAVTLGPRAIPTPFLNVQQRITLASAVIGPRSIPTTHRVAAVQSIRPSTVTGPRAVPSPTVKGSTQYARVSTVLGPRKIGIPALNGGKLDCLFLVGGSDVSQYVDWTDNAIRIESQTIGRWKAAFQLRVHTGVATFQPSPGMTVQIIDLGTRLFMGCMTEVIIERLMMTANEIVYHCTATDKSGICDRRVVTGKTYNATDDAVGVVLDICTNFLAGEGIDTSAMPAIGALGALGAQLKLNFTTVTQAFDQVCNLIGCIWYVDVNGRLQFSPFASLPAAPFGLTETSANWRNLMVKVTTENYYNKLYAVSNLNILPGSGSSGSAGGTGAGNTETFTWTPDGPGIQTITNSSGTRVAVGITCSTPIGSVQSLTVNGVAQTVVDFGAYSGQTPSGADLLWFFGGPATGSPAPFLQPTVLAAAGATIIVRYTPAVSTSSSTAQYGTALNPLNPSGQPLGTCGSGLFEGVIQTKNVSSQSDLNAIAAAELARIGGVPSIANYETDYPGLAPGQSQSIVIPLAGISVARMLITQVSGTFVAPPGSLGHGGSFRWQVEARSNLDPGNWAKWYEQLVGRTANPLPVLQADPITFVSSGSALSGGTPFGNPYIVQRTCRVLGIQIAAGSPPVNQSLTVSLATLSGTFLGSVTLPPTATANQLFSYTVPTTQQLYIFAGDVVTATVTYAATSTSTPVAASGVTVKCSTAV